MLKGIRVREMFLSFLNFYSCPSQGQHSQGNLRAYTSQWVMAHRYTNEVNLLSPQNLMCNRFCDPVKEESSPWPSLTFPKPYLWIEATHPNLYQPLYECFCYKPHFGAYSENDVTSRGRKQPEIRGGKYMSTWLLGRNQPLSIEMSMQIQKHSFSP